MCFKQTALMTLFLQCHQSFTGARTVQRDAFFASLCPLRQFANFFSLLFLRGRRDFIAGHFYESRLTRVSNGTLFSRPCVPCVNLLIVLQCRQLLCRQQCRQRDARTKGLYCGTFFRRPAQRDTLTGHCRVPMSRFNQSFS